MLGLISNKKQQEIDRIQMGLQRFLSMMNNDANKLLLWLLWEKINHVFNAQTIYLFCVFFNCCKQH